jgi:hypothetical protein
MALMSSDFPRENSATNAIVSLSSSSRSSSCLIRNSVCASARSFSCSQRRNATMRSATSARHAL